MSFPHPWCLWTTIRNWIWGMLVVGTRVQGHSFREDVRWTQCNVNILRCELCGRFEVLWERTARSEYFQHRDEPLTPEQAEARKMRQLAREGDTGSVITSAKH